MARALAICAEHGGEPGVGRTAPADARDGAGDGAADAGGRRGGSWREAFLGAPYLRDVFVAMGVLARDLRDGDHLGALPGPPRARHAPPARRERSVARGRRAAPGR